MSKVLFTISSIKNIYFKYLPRLKYLLTLEYFLINHRTAVLART